MSPERAYDPSSYDAWLYSMADEYMESLDAEDEEEKETIEPVKESEEEG